MTLAPDLRSNGLLAVLPASVLARLTPHLERVQLLQGDTLCEPGESLQYAYFPTSTIVSLCYVLESGGSTEVAGVGNEGVLGTWLILGTDSTPCSAIVQATGLGYRISARALKEEFERVGPLRSLLMRYTMALVAQVFQSASCNRHHSIEQQLCRWLLQTLDRLPTSELVITQELLAGALGVRREGVTEAAGRLKRAGIIGYRRGHISVLERSGLESGACECYSVVRQEMGRLLSAA